MTEAELVDKVVRIIETIPDRPFAATLIVDVVARGLGKLGGRPRRLVGGTSEVSAGLETGYETPATSQQAEITRTDRPRESARRSSLRSGSGSGSEISEEKEKREERSPSAASSPAFLTFPVTGTGGAEWIATEALVAEHQAAFPALDVRAEYRQALAWLRANPSRRKTVRGMPGFLVGWLGRAQNRRGGQAQLPVRVNGYAKVEPGKHYPNGEQEI